MFSILSLNVNDFGGIDHHLMEYKKLNWQGKEVTDWLSWKESVDKKIPLLAILDYMKKVSPSILILQEFEVNNSDESKEFIEQLTKYNYSLISNIPSYKASVTAVFVKSEYKTKTMVNPNTLDGRSYTFRIEDVIIHGTHVPSKGNERVQTFWDEIETFYKKFCKEKVLLIGDFNTINAENMKRYKQLLNIGGIDVWIEKGYADNIPTCGNIRMDMAIVSPELLPYVTDITICSSLLYKGMTNHTALMVDIGMRNK